MPAPLRKRVLKSNVVLLVLSYVLSCVIRFLYLTARVERQVDKQALRYLRGEAPCIFAFWHGRLAMQSYHNPRNRPAYVLISRHGDGRMISTIIKRFGVHTIHGSTGKGVHAAMRGFDEVVASGGIIAITPDGPRGPYQKAAPGAAYLAIKHQYPVVCLSFSASRHWRLKSWDRFMIPKPFTQLALHAAAPLMFTADASLKDATRAIEQRLNEVTHSADIACGVAA